MVDGSCSSGHLIRHLEALLSLESHCLRLDDWGRRLAGLMSTGGRMLAAGNGGSAAQAQHLTAELVGRFRDERRALSALSLHSETSSLTAIANDYGYEQVFARQVRAHGRPGDALLVLSTSGASPNLVAAVKAAHETGLSSFALTGPAPNPLERLCQDAICVRGGDAAIVQEIHLVAVHIICAAVDAACQEGPRDLSLEVI